MPRPRKNNNLESNTTMTVKWKTKERVRKFQDYPEQTDDKVINNVCDLAESKAQKVRRQNEQN